MKKSICFFLTLVLLAQGIGLVANADNEPDNIADTVLMAAESSEEPTAAAEGIVAQDEQDNIADTALTVAESSDEPAAAAEDIEAQNEQDDSADTALTAAESSEGSTAAAEDIEEDEQDDSADTALTAAESSEEPAAAAEDIEAQNAQDEQDNSADTALMATVSLESLTAAAVAVAGNQADFAELTVTKSFVGLSEEDIEALKDTYEIAITDSSGTLSRTLTLSNSVSVEGNTYTWVLKLNADNYTLTESGYDVPGYTCVPTVAVDGGTPEPGVSAPAVLKAPVYGGFDLSYTRFTSCASTTIPGINSVFICFSFTNKYGGAYDFLIWTEEPLTEDVYNLLLKYIANSVGPFGKIAANNTIYLSGDTGFSYPEGTYEPTELVFYNTSTRFLTILNEGTWNQFLYGDLTPFLELFTSEVAFTNTYTEIPRADLTVSKTVKGSAANPYEHFDFTLSSEGLSGTYNVSYTGTDNCSTTHPATITFENGEATLTLKHGETATIEGLFVGTVITVTETSGSYATTVNGEPQSQSSAAVTIAEGDNSLAFVNTMEPPPVTGISMDAIPYIILLALVAAGAGVFAAVRHRKKRAADDWNE